MTEVPDLFKTRAGPSGTRFGEIRSFSVIDSTNRYLLDEAAAGAADGLVVVAAHQSAGRGRRGRVWDSKPGASLLLSVLLRPRNASVALQAAQAMGLAILDACNVTAGVTAQLKWPNDVLVEDRKVAGVLAEAVSNNGEITAVVMGAGVNLNWASELPDALQTMATSLDNHAGHPIDSDVFLDALLRALHERLSRPTWLLQAYRQRCVTIGAPVRIERADDVLVGTAIDVADDGSLLLEQDNGDVISVMVGDVVHLRSIDAL